MNFKALDHRMRTLALVGQFLQYWAIMEGSINDAIGKALRMDDLQGLIVAKNVQFRDKIFILKTALTLTHLGQQDRDKYTDILDDIAGVAHVRNMMAHDMFIPSPKSDGVEFLVIKAKGKLNFPQEDWPVTTFEEWFRKLDRWDDEIDALEKALVPSATNALVNALLQTSNTPLPLREADRAGPLLPGILGPIPNEPTPEKGDENPPTDPLK